MQQSENLENEQIPPAEEPNESPKETPEYTAEPVEIFPETEQPASDEAQPQPESRARRFARKLVRWTLGFLIVIGVGFLIAVFLIYQPKVQELKQAQANLTNIEATIAAQEAQILTLESQIDALNKQVESLNEQIEGLKEEKQALLAEQGLHELQIVLLQTHANVLSAQIALFESNPARARILLKNASEQLAEFETMLPKDSPIEIAPLQARLELALNELDNAPETAIQDLNILAGDLLITLENLPVEIDG